MIFEEVRLPLITARAMTIGSIVLVMNSDLQSALDELPSLLIHEEEHTWQYAYCLGLPFLPLYGLATLWSLARTKDRGLENFFEQEAGLDSGGYLSSN